MVKIIHSNGNIKKSNKIKFKLIFEDSTQSLLDADDFTDAAILSMAARIRSGKTKKIVAAWSRDEQNNWNNVVQQSVKIDF